MRKRIISLLLALVMLLSLMPSLAVPAHAFWDDYDDGFDCPNCDHYHFGSDYMCDCLFCTIDCNYECWVETHCNDCGVCFGDTPYWCEECYKCAECMEEKHCSTCAKCYIGEDDQLCGECHKGPCCSISICDSCGFCDDCANDDSDPMHCSLCNACFGAVDECVDDDDTGIIHCVDCHTACEQCEECLLAKESCEECGLCLECCRDNSEDGGCPDGETCVESAEWDEHICRAATAGSRIRRTRTSSAKSASCARSAARATPTAPWGCAQWIRTTRITSARTAACASTTATPARTAAISAARTAASMP